MLDASELKTSKVKQFPKKRLFQDFQVDGKNIFFFDLKF